MWTTVSCFPLARICCYADICLSRNRKRPRSQSVDRPPCDSGPAGGNTVIPVTEHEEAQRRRGIHSKAAHVQTAADGPQLPAHCHPTGTSALYWGGVSITLPTLNLGTGLGQEFQPSGHSKPQSQFSGAPSSLNVASKLFYKQQASFTYYST